MVMERFSDRREAGQLLADKLQSYGKYAVVFALPRGGVEIGVEVSAELGTPLELVIARKIGHPLNPEYAIGAVTESGPVIWNEAETAALDKLWLEQQEAEQRAEARRRREKYLAGHQPISAIGKTAIVVDDGIATGLTMRAAVDEIKQHKPSKIVVAVPCAPRDAVEELRESVDDVIVLTNPDTFVGAVGSYYEHFPQLDDEDVLALL